MKRSGPSAVAAIAADVAAWAIGRREKGRENEDAGARARRGEQSRSRRTGDRRHGEGEDVVGDEVTRARARALGVGVDGRRRLMLDDDARLEDALFDSSSTEVSLRGGRANLPRVDSFEGEIKFEDVLPSIESAVVVPDEEEGRRPPTPGTTRPWLSETPSDETESEPLERSPTTHVLKSPRRNGSMNFVSAEDEHERSLRLLSTPTLAPRVRRLDSPLTPRSPQASERALDIFMNGENVDTQPFSRSTSISSIVSAFTPISRTTSQGDISGNTSAPFSSKKIS